MSEVDPTIRNECHSSQRRCRTHREVDEALGAFASGLNDHPHRSTKAGAATRFPLRTADVLREVASCTSRLATGPVHHAAGAVSALQIDRLPTGIPPSRCSTRNLAAGCSRPTRRCRARSRPRGARPGETRRDPIPECRCCRRDEARHRGASGLAGLRRAEPLATGSRDVATVTRRVGPGGC